jgi:ribosomal protein S18 acetylase RimI-like enzyme
MPLTIRPFTRDYVDFALEQTRREGWDNTAALFELSLAHDPQGCFIAELDGEPAGLITSTRYERSAWLGNLIVAPEARRRGVGERLMKHAIRGLQESGIHTFRLEADPMGLRLYRKLGFVDQFDVPRFLKNPPHHEEFPRAAVAVTSSHFGEVCSYDRDGFGDDRSRILESILETAPSVFCVRHNDGTFAGYAATIATENGIRFGPCVADDPEATTILIDAVLAGHSDVAVVTAVPSVNLDAIEALSSQGFRRIGASTRMRLGPSDAESDPKKLVAIAYGAIG